MPRPKQFMLPPLRLVVFYLCRYHRKIIFVSCRTVAIPWPAISVLISVQHLLHFFFFSNSTMPRRKRLDSTQLPAGSVEHLAQRRPSPSYEIEDPVHSRFIKLFHPAPNCNPVIIQSSDRAMSPSTVPSTAPPSTNHYHHHYHHHHYSRTNSSASTYSSFSNRPAMYRQYPQPTEVATASAVASATATRQNSTRRSHRSHSHRSHSHASRETPHYPRPMRTPSLEAMSQIRVPSMTLRKSPSMVSLKQSPIRNFFIRLFRRRRLPRFRATIRRRLHRGPKQQPIRAQISQPLNVVKHAGLSQSANGEVLSIRSRQSLVRRSPSASYSTLPSKYSYRTREIDDLDRRLDCLQRDLDETRMLNRRLSSKSRRSTRASANSTSVGSSILDRHVYTPNRPSRQRSTGPSRSNTVHTIREDDANVEEALAFVGSWSAYLRRAIAVRIVLRQQVHTLEQQEQAAWQRLNAVAEEDESITGDTETVSSFGTTSTAHKVQADLGESSIESSLYSTAEESARENVYWSNSDAISLTPVSTPTPPLHKHKRTASSVRRMLRPEVMANKYSALVGSNQQPAEIASPHSSSSRESFSAPGKESAWMRSVSASVPRPLPPAPPQRTASAPSSPSDSSGRRSTSSLRAGIPKLLQQQRYMSDKILADMVQEMEELQARSMLLSGMAKLHLQDSGALGMLSASGSESEMSVSDAASVSSGSSMPGVPRPRPSAKASASSLQKKGHYMLAPSDSVGKPAQDEVPRKVSGASAAAGITLARGKLNRRRPRSGEQTHRTERVERSDRGMTEWVSAE